MAIKAGEILQLALQAELKLAALYEDLAARMKPGGAEARFFSTLAKQEHDHATWVKKMIAAADPDYEFVDFAAKDFTTILITIDDVHDEVITERIDVPGSLEILLHLENSTAENFYLQFPPDIPGLPEAMVARMVRSCVEHSKAIVQFRNRLRRGE